jgi:glycosyltransferase involved in cell wall biosynthesis
VAAPTFKEISTKISDLKCCVIIPTYNNDTTLKKVVDGVLNYTSNIIIVNDGSNDNTSIILKEFTDLIQIKFIKNKGKGMALRKGFERAFEEGFEFAITIDSDGQHYPDDIPIFINELEKDKNILLIGSRNMTHDSVPKNSSFGNKFSNFWFWVDTEIWLTDTQSGYRVYPLKVANEIKFYTTKFEFEIEAIVKIAWRDVDVKNVPINVLYSDDRVSHFRPYKDFARISVLNTWLFLVAILYIKPRNIIRRIKKKGIKRILKENVIQSQDPPLKKSLSIALGVFIGIAPLWGFQTILVFALAIPLKLNKLIAFTFSNISIPPMIPFIIYGSLLMGGWILGTDTRIDFENISANAKLLGDIKEYIVGSFALALVSALLFGSVGYIILKIISKK